MRISRSALPLWSVCLVAYFEGKIKILLFISRAQFVLQSQHHFCYFFITGLELHTLISVPGRLQHTDLFEMTSTKPALSPAGRVTPWIQKFTNDPRDSFIDQFVDSDDARFVEIREVNTTIPFSTIP